MFCNLPKTYVIFYKDKKPPLNFLHIYEFKIISSIFTTT